MHFRRKSLTVPPPEADLGVPQLGLSEHGIEVVRGHLGPVLLHLSEVEGDSTPCPPQAGDLKHLAIIPQRQLREPWLNRALAVKEKAKLFKIRDTCFNQRVHYDWVKAEVRAQRLQRVLNPRGLPRHQTQRTRHAVPGIPSHAPKPEFPRFAGSSSPRATDHSTAKRGLTALMCRCATG